MKRLATKCFAKYGVWVVLAMVLLAASAPASQKKNKKKDQPAADSQKDFNPAIPDSQAIDQTIGEMLGYWQIGDLDSLHKYYADDVVLVSGLWEPPIIGWDNYAKAFEEQRAHITGARMDRSNTLIKVNGNSAWATYQFVFMATMDGRTAQFRGHTTLILDKQGGRWVIVLNHSSLVDNPNSSPAPSADSGPPSQH